MSVPRALATCTAVVLSLGAAGAAAPAAVAAGPDILVG